MKTNLIKFIFINIFFLGNIIYAQGDFDLEDLNPNSEFFSQFIGPGDFLEDIVIVYFGHEY
tara:strand:+ start:251 stop:433 length:183 start_codon:yes stop_codon:yes gene_type:complete